ncbi:MAG: YdcF family protein [Chitinophagaceae bacterium]|nr:YdcF family protein [Chitinophagaceae bacterium]
MTIHTITRICLFTVSISIIACSCAFTGRSSSKFLAKARNSPYDLIVVPGVPLEKGKWSRAMKARVYWSKYLYDQGIAKNIMYSGSAVYTPCYEAKVMALYAEAIGVPKEHIFIETKAEHSTENIYYSYKKARKLGFGRIALATDPFQAKLLRGFIWKKVSHDVDVIPIVYDTLKAMEPDMKDPVIDSQQAFVENFIPLTERESWWKRFRGTRGLNLNPAIYDDMIQAEAVK